MESRMPAAFLLMILLIVPVSTAIRVPASFGKFGRLVPAVVRGDDVLTAVINSQYDAHHQHLQRPLRESGAPERSEDHVHDECQRLNGIQLTRCQRIRFERVLAEDYEDAKPNVNVVFAPLPA